MSRKKSVPTKSQGSPPVLSEDETRKLTYARALLRPSTLAASTLDALKLGGDKTDLVSLAAALREEASRVTARNDLCRAEAMLAIQSHTLDALFCALTKRALLNMGEHLDATEAYMRMALRAQSQCRATLETLALLKNPPNPTFIRQANVAHGPQQVNNAAAPAHELSRTRESEKRQTELLEHDHGERLDTRAASTASGADPAMATLGTVDRTQDRRR
jgi:hypothetical protein